MTLRSALQDVKETTLSAIAGLLGRLKYLASLRQQQGQYKHWGVESVHGAEAAARALKTAHGEVLRNVLRTPLPALEQDLDLSSKGAGMNAEGYLEQLETSFGELLPEGQHDSAASTHLSSVLVALCHLQKNREDATRITS